MSEANQVFNNGNMTITNYDITKLFLRDTRFVTAEFTNGTGAELVLPAGTLLARTGADNKAVIIDKTATTTGAQIPLGVNASSVTIAIAATVTLTVCVRGEIEKSLVVLPAGTDYDDNIQGRTLEDRIMGDTLGILLITSENLTEFDNQ